MKNIKINLGKILLGLLCIITYNKTQGQNDILLNHYMFNELAFNPSTAGNKPGLNASVFARRQWIGISEAPLSQVLNIHAYIKNFGGLGVSLINDALGLEKTLNLKVNYAHYVQVSKTSMLSFGVGIGFINKSIEVSKLIFEDDDDLGAVFNYERRFKPDFNFGLEFNASNLSLGISSTHMEQSLLMADNFNVPRHYYAYGRYLIHIDNKIDIMPAFLVKSSIFITQFDLSMLLYFDNKVWVGGSFRPVNYCAGLIGFNINKNLAMGYAYDMLVGNKAHFNNGSHELYMSYKSLSSNKKHHGKSPRYF